ncbi:MAG TPA: class II glutamine amidotransferase, partial [Desulfatiglandales bacterium]|nr:class II glutamine amidotransferase [Desulfatiglandales bacterium]
AGFNYTPKQYLPLFAERGRRNMNGWAIGFFREGQALVEASPEQVHTGYQVHEGFQRLARVIDSRIIVAHVRCSQSGGHHQTDSYLFTLSFLDHDWLFAHVGIVEGIQQYLTRNEPRLDADAYSARIFEYLRDQLLSLYALNPYLSLEDALGTGIKRLVSDHPGHYAFFLANESVIFAFCNFRHFLLLREAELMGDILLMTTVEEGLSANKWFPLRREEGSRGKLVVVAGPELLHIANV